MATEEILMAGVRAGGDRQQLHELLRRHSQAAAEQVKLQGRANDLLDRLAQEPAFAELQLSKMLNPQAFIGRSPQQVERFVADVVTPIRARYRASHAAYGLLKV